MEEGTEDSVHRCVLTRDKWGRPTRRAGNWRVQMNE